MQAYKPDSVLRNHSEPLSFIYAAYPLQPQISSGLGAQPKSAIYVALQPTRFT